MAHPDPLPQGALDAVVHGISQKLPSLLGDRLLVTTKVEVTASFEVRQLDADAVQRKDGSGLQTLAAPNGRWHHQIAVDGEPRLYARSVPDRDWAVEELTESDTAARVDAAMDRIDAMVPEDDLVKLLRAPDYRLVAFWLIGKSGRVLVAEAAQRLVPLDPTWLYEEPTFLDVLRTVRPVKGIEVPD